MVNYLERVRAEHAQHMDDQQAKTQSANQRTNTQWSERLTPL